ncbi:MAG TPA: MFS transporter [Ktedonosporobacter sp.]|nr:MFS transporter [Ktedonosporobacter sp.]
MAKSVSLWRHYGFLLLWGGQSISQLGSQVTRWALPLTAVLFLKATPFQMGLLLALGNLPSLLAGLLAGAWVDRVRRRPLLIVTDIGRALMLGSIPVAAWLGLLSMLQLYLIAFLTGILTVVFNVAYRSFLPSLVERDHLVEGNSKLGASEAVAGIVGPGLAGGLVQWLSGPTAILGDAFSFLVSALSLALIRVQEKHLPEAQTPRHLWREIGEGLSTVFHHPILRTLAGVSGLFNFFDSLLMTVYVLYLTQTIGISAAQVGIVFAVGGIGGLLGALLASRVTGRLGLGPALLASVLLASVAELAIGVAGGPVLPGFLLVAIAEALVEAATTLYSINGVSLRQAIVPIQLQGRVNATMNVVAYGAIPLGALLGGLLGGYGLRLTVLLAGGGVFLAFLWVLLSPVRHLHALPTEPDGIDSE